MKHKIELFGTQQNPDMMYMNMKAQGEMIEGYIKGDKAVLGSSQTDTWELQNDMTTGGKTQMLPLKQILNAARYIKSSKFINGVEINGIQCKGVSVDLKSEGLVKLCNLEAVAKKCSIEFQDANYLLWYDPENFLPYRITINFKAKLESMREMAEMSFLAECELFDYDQNVEIVFPEKVREMIF